MHTLGSDSFKAISMYIATNFYWFFRFSKPVVYFFEVSAEATGKKKQLGYSASLGSPSLQSQKLLLLFPQGLSHSTSVPSGRE
jgi:hypothetical protein